MKTSTMTFFKINFIFTFCLLAVLTACSPERPRPQASCGFVQDDHRQRISWKQEFPIPIFVESQFPKEYRPAITEAVEVWESALGSPLFEIHQLEEGSEPQQDNQSIIYWSTRWNNDSREEQGQTKLYTQGPQILESDIKINATAKDFEFYFKIPQENLSKSSSELSLENSYSSLVESSKVLPKIHLVSLLIHELGHFLGFDHNQDKESVMKERLAPEEERVKLSEQDLQHLHCVYGGIVSNNSNKKGK